MPLTANDIWRDFETAGVPASGAHKPIKADIRAWGTTLESAAAFAAPGAALVPLFSNGVGVPPVYRAIVGFDLPNPSTTTPGVVFATPGIANQVVAGLGADGQLDLAPVTGTGSVVLNNAPNFVGTFNMAGLPFAAASGGSNIIYGPDGRLALQLTTAQGFYKSDSHAWYNGAGSDQYAALGASSLQLLPLPVTGPNNPAFTITQTWNTSSILVGVDWQFITTAADPTSRAWRIRSGPAGTTELIYVVNDVGFAVLGLGGRAVFAAPSSAPNIIYSANAIGINFNNSSGTNFRTQMTDVGTWLYFGTTSGSHSVAPPAVASGASTWPTNNGELLNTGTGFPVVMIGAALDFNLVGDTAIPVKLPLGFTRYRVSGIIMTNTGPGAASITAATFGVFTAPSGGGSAVQAAGTGLTGLTSNTPNTNGSLVGIAVTMTLAAFDIATVPTLYARITTAQGAAAAGRIGIQIQPIP